MKQMFIINLYDAGHKILQPKSLKVEIRKPSKFIFSQQKFIEEWFSLPLPIPTIESMQL